MLQIKEKKKKNVLSSFALKLGKVRQFYKQHIDIYFQKLSSYGEGYFIFPLLLLIGYLPTINIANSLQKTIIFFLSLEV